MTTTPIPAPEDTRAPVEAPAVGIGAEALGTASAEAPPGAPAATPDAPSAPPASDDERPEAVGDPSSSSSTSTPAPAVEAAAGSAHPAASQAESRSQPSLSPAAVAARLAELFPAVFGGPSPKPLKLRIQADIQQRAPGAFTKRQLSGFLQRHTTGSAYLKALAHGTDRIDLDGLPAGAVADEHRAAAVAELQRRRALHDERRALERQQARQAHVDARKAEHEARKAQDRARRADDAARRASEEAARGVREAEGGARAARASLLRAFESTTLTRANFCALKGIAPSELDAALALAREERTRHATAPLRPLAPATPRPAPPPRTHRRPERPRRPPGGRDAKDSEHERERGAASPSSPQPERPRRDSGPSRAPEDRARAGGPSPTGGSDRPPSEAPNADPSMPVDGRHDG